MESSGLYIKVSQKKKKKLSFEMMLGIPYILIAVIFIVLPMFILVLTSFNSRSSQGFDIQFTGMHYYNLIITGPFLVPLGRSLLYAGIATVITVLIAYPLAYFIARRKESTQKILVTLISVPMWINMLIRLYALKQVMSQIDQYFYQENAAVIIAMVFSYLPFMVLPIHSVLAKFDNNLFESAADLGANKVKTFFKVVVPLSLSGVLSGVIMVFLPVATSIVITHSNFFGNGLTLVGQLIESSIVKTLYGGYGYGAAISIVLSLIMVFLVFLMRKADKFQGGNVSEE